MKVDFITRKFVRLSLDDPNLDSNAVNLLIEKKHHIEIEFFGVSEIEFLNEIRGDSVHVKITEQGKPDPIIDCVYIFHGYFPATVSHLVNERYLNPADQYSQFLTVWSRRLNNYSEFFINDYKRRVCNRFVP